MPAIYTFPRMAPALDLKFLLVFYLIVLYLYVRVWTRKEGFKKYGRQLDEPLIVVVHIRPKPIGKVYAQEGKIIRDGPLLKGNSSFFIFSFEEEQTWHIYSFILVGPEKPAIKIKSL
jgi:hypothetical protein